MNQGSLSLSVRLRHPAMPPAEISAAMGVDPVAAHAVGERRRSPAGRQLVGNYAETYWAYRFPDRSDTDIGEAIQVANDWMRHRATFIADFKQNGGAVEYYVSADAKSRLATELPASVLHQCAQFGLQLSLEVFRD